MSTSNQEVIDAQMEYVGKLMLYIDGQPNTPYIALMHRIQKEPLLLLQVLKGDGIGLIAPFGFTEHKDGEVVDYHPLVKVVDENPIYIKHDQHGNTERTLTMLEAAEEMNWFPVYEQKEHFQLVKQYCQIKAKEVSWEEILQLVMSWRSTPEELIQDLNNKYVIKQNHE